MLDSRPDAAKSLKNRAKSSGRARVIRVRQNQQLSDARHLRQYATERGISFLRFAAMRVTEGDFS